MTITADGVLALVDVIHAGATCGAARARSARALSDAFDGAAVMLFRQADALVEDLEYARWPEESVALCSGRFSDPAANRVLRTLPVAPIGLPLRADRVRDGFETSDVYVHAMQPFGLKHPLGALLARTERDVSVLSLMRRGRAPPFGDEHELLLSQLMPALTSADRVRRLLVEAMEARQLLEQALDSVGRPLAVVDDALRLRYANAPAQAALEDGGALRLRAGKVSAARARAEDGLRTAVREAVAPGGSGGVVPLELGRTMGTVRVEPLRPGEAGVAQPLALLVGAARTPIAPSKLRVLYGLTPREAEVAALFAVGNSVRDAAKGLGRSPNTIKTEARQIYAKLGVCSHAEAAVRIREDLAI